MAIMQTCCCWRSVRRGSFACAAYSVLYYSVIAVTLSSVLQEESQYLAGNRSQPKSSSILEAEVSPGTVVFNIALLVCSSLGVICCLLLLYGLFKDEKMFLVPWICVMIACCVVDISHLIYVFFSVGMKFNPVTAMILTIDFFLMCINIYSAVCVISQYQEYGVGRGTAAHDCPQRVPAVRYTVPATATATSCLSSRRTTTTGIEGRLTPIQSPTTLLTIVHPPPSANRLIVPPGNNELRLPGRKHVKFPDVVDHDAIERIDETLAIQICPAEESDDDDDDDDEDEEEDDEEDDEDYYRRRRRKNGTARNGGF